MDGKHCEGCEGSVVDHAWGIAKPCSGVTCASCAEKDAEITALRAEQGQLEKRIMTAFRLTLRDAIALARKEAKEDGNKEEA